MKKCLKLMSPTQNVGNSYFKFSYMFSFVNFKKNFFSKVKNQSQVDSNNQVVVCGYIQKIMQGILPIFSPKTKI